MNTTDPFARLNRSRPLMLLALLCMFLIMLLCNFQTSLLVDDYTYCFSFADSSRIERVADCFPSMVAHRHLMNGRVVAHFLVQVFLLLPLGIFKVLNALVLVAEVYLVYKLANRKVERNNLLLCCIFGCIWIYTPSFGQVILWLDGSVNYLWASFFSLLFLTVYINKFMDGRDIKALPLRILYVLTAFLVGAYSENGASTVIFCSVCLLLLGRFVKKQRIAPYLWLAVLAAFGGFLFMLSAPAEIANKASALNIFVLFDNFTYVLDSYRRLWVLLAVYIVLAVAAYRLALDRDLQYLAFLLVLGSLAAAFVLSFASYVQPRSLCISVVLLIAGCAVLFVPLFETVLQPGLVSLSLVCLMLSFYWGCIGVQDIHETHHYIKENEEHIIACREAGIMDVEIPCVYPKTEYCAAYGLRYISDTDPNTWPNSLMATYYGVDSIIGR